MPPRKGQSALLAKYLEMHRRSPGSRVFAPLAESYRKLGMIDDALKILKEGIKRHPTYVLGYLVLAHCYYDQGKKELCYNTLRPLVATNLDNIGLQKLFAQTCFDIGNLDESLEAYKYLLFLNPKDSFFAGKVKELEDDLLSSQDKKIESKVVKSPPAVRGSDFTMEDDEWVQVSFNSQKTHSQQTAQALVEQETDVDDWDMSMPGTEFKPKTFSIQQEEINVIKRDLDDEFFADDESSDEEQMESLAFQKQQEVSEEGELPLVSHTLVDLYIGQGYHDKAAELLEKILEINPKDQRSHIKLTELRSMMQETSPIETNVIEEEDAHMALLDLVEQSVKSTLPDMSRIENAFAVFLKQVKQVSREKLGHA